LIGQQQGRRIGDKDPMTGRKRAMSKRQDAKGAPAAIFHSKNLINDFHTD
jgi:hypothetical protein